MNKYLLAVLWRGQTILVPSFEKLENAGETTYLINQQPYSVKNPAKESVREISCSKNNRYYKDVPIDILCQELKEGDSVYVAIKGKPAIIEEGIIKKLHMSETSKEWLATVLVDDKVYSQILTARRIFKKQ